MTKDLEAQEYNVKTALVCIAKNEDNYIQEWIEYHLKLGFDKIYVYENNWRCHYNNDNLIKIPFDGALKQVSAYNTFINTISVDYDWVGFIDVDEFLVLKKDNTIKEFFFRFRDKPGIGINWLLFGNNGLNNVIDNEYSVIKRFTKRGKDVNPHIKTFINLTINRNVNMSVHNPNIAISNQDFNSFYGPFCNQCSIELAQLNHYFCKTFEEFKQKVDRGRADTSAIRNYNEFEPHNLNEVEDLLAYNFYYKK